MSDVRDQSRTPGASALGSGNLNYMVDRSLRRLVQCAGAAAV
jgi:hypothetical protein